MNDEWEGPEKARYPYIMVLDPYTPVLINVLSVFTKDDVNRIKHNIKMRQVDAKHPCVLVMTLRGITSVLQDPDDIPVPVMLAKRTKK